jgi:hypothetical protein
MAAGEQARLAIELGFYALHKNEWLEQYAGQYIVINKNQVLDFYPSFEAAFRAGAAAFGINTDFLVKQILEHEPVFFVFGLLARDPRSFA